MSDELNQTEEKKCHKKLIAAGIITSLVLSCASIALSGVTLLAATGKIPGIEMGTPLPISKKYDRGQSLDKALKKNKPIIAFFYADWCGYCQRFAPTFAEVSKNKDVKKNLAVAFVNVEDNQNQKYVEEYQIQGFPMVYLINPANGKKVLVENRDLFAPGAKESLVKTFVDFAKGE